MGSGSVSESESELGGEKLTLVLGLSWMEIEKGLEMGFIKVGFVGDFGAKMLVGFDGDLKFECEGDTEGRK